MDERNDTTLPRRDFMVAAGAMAMLGALGASPPTTAQGTTAAADDDPAQQMMPGMSMPMLPGPRPKVGILIYPKMVLLDLVGPLTAMTILRAETHLCWKDKTPCSTDVGIPVTASNTLEECPADLDVLIVPGGLMGTIDAMNDPAVLDFVRDRAGRAKWVTGFCTGSLVLGAAGLLIGRKATGHWGIVELLPRLGATVAPGRIVEDGNLVTAGGSTAGIDLGIRLAALLKGEEAARRVQLTLEYAPDPPFRNGTPAEAGPERAADARHRRAWMDEQAQAAVAKARARLRLE